MDTEILTAAEFFWTLESGSLHGCRYSCGHSMVPFRQIHAEIIPETVSHAVGVHQRQHVPDAQCDAIGVCCT